MNYAMKTGGLCPRQKKSSSPAPFRAEGVKEMPPTPAGLATSFSDRILPCLDQISTTLTESKDRGLREIYFKTREGQWIVGRKAADRELLLLLNRNADSLEEAETAWQEAREASFHSIST